MTTHHVHADDPDSWPAAFDTSEPGDTILLHAGVYPYALDSYTTRIQGGTSWSTKLTIKPYLRDRVILRPVGGDFVLRLAHAISSYVEIGSSLVDLEIDASGLEPNGPATGVKITSSSGDAGPSKCRLLRLRVHSAHHQGILVTVPRVEIIGGASYGNGHTTNPESANKDHGLYLGAGSAGLVRDFDTFDNAAYGIHEYGGQELNRVGPNRIEGGYHIANGRLAPRAGVILSGTGSVVRNVVSRGNATGIEIYHTARDCQILDNDLRGNTQEPLGIAAAAIGTVERGNEV